MESCEFSHVPVLYKESIEALAIKENGIYIDCTLGGGGHSQGILEKLGSEGRLIAFDKDEEAVAAGTVKLDKVNKRASYSVIHRDFREIADSLEAMKIEKVDGILADLGVSSHQLDSPARGFSYRYDSDLDMRMDRRQEVTAKELINSLDQNALTRIFREYGEEKYASSIASGLVRKRNEQELTTTEDLVACIMKSIPAEARRKKHPAKKVFQALRIAVNDELGALESLLDFSEGRLRNSGRLCIISFHSLEDRLIKQRFKAWEHPCDCPAKYPCVCGKKPWGEVVYKQGLTASSEELRENPRASSARLRVFEAY